MIDAKVTEAVKTLVLVPLTFMQMAEESRLPKDFVVSYVAMYLACVRRLSLAAGMPDVDFQRLRSNAFTNALDKMGNCVARYGSPTLSATFDQRFARLRDDLQAATERSRG
jgi:hypothetical protein